MGPEKNNVVTEPSPYLEIGSEDQHKSMKLRNVPPPTTNLLIRLGETKYLEFEYFKLNI